MTQSNNKSRLPQSQTNWGEGRAHIRALNTFERREERIITLRTVPVILKRGKKRLHLNGFLDGDSETTYVYH